MPAYPKGANGAGWDDIRVELAKTLWSEGKSAQQIADRLGGLTRSAVLGKLHRLKAAHLAPPYKKRSSHNNTYKRKRRPRVFGKAIPDHAARAEWLRALAEDRAAAQIAPDLVVPEHERKQLDDLMDDDCRWIHGDPKKSDYHYCNRKRITSLPYCDFHAKRAFQPPFVRNDPYSIGRPLRVRGGINAEHSAALKEFDAMERA